MSTSADSSLEWVVLTMGDRPDALGRAVASLADRTVTVVLNDPSGAGAQDATIAGAEMVPAGSNLGVPGGRDHGMSRTSAPVVGFLDDDAELRGDVESIERAFAADSGLGAVSLRLVDEDGQTTRRHVPRLGGRDAAVSGDVALFLGGACAIRREAYDQAGGYFVDLFYGHEEVELCWRLVDAGWRVQYLADVEVFHPKSTIERHADGWALTGRNRVLIARRTLPIPVAAIHVAFWLAIGTFRAPAGASRRAYVAGWRSGWRIAVERSAISWRGVWRLVRLRRPPIL